MANIKISELEKLTNVASDDYFPIVDSSAGETKKTEINSILNLVFPIGRGFIDFTDTDYSNYLGFTWERELVGMVGVGLDVNQSEFNQIGKTGGEKTHVLTSNEMPSHTHTQASCTDPGNHKHTISTWYNGQSASAQTIEGWGTKKHEKYHYTGDAGSHTHTITLNNTGGGQAHNNMPPYMTVYMWKRIL